MLLMIIAYVISFVVLYIVIIPLFYFLTKYSLKIGFYNEYYELHAYYNKLFFEFLLCMAAFWMVTWIIPVVIICFVSFKFIIRALYSFFLVLIYLTLGCKVGKMRSR